MNHLTNRFHTAIAVIAFFTGFAFSPVYGQEFHYRFQVQNITDAAGANLLTDLIRPLFNHPEDPYRVLPVFDDALNQFDFVSDVLVTKQQLEDVMKPKGIVVLGYGVQQESEEDPMQETKP